jgi:Protein of unknown function (DUF3891)
VLVRRHGDGALVIGQLSHAWLAGQLAAAWGNARFPAPEPRAAVVLGAQQHDIGWESVDMRPQLNADTGLPRSFLEMAVEEHLAIWRGVPERLLSQSSHAALAVSLHGCALSERRARRAPQEAELLRAHIEEERRRQELLGAALGVSAAQRERIQRQMWAWDGLSLALCDHWRPFSLERVPSSGGETAIELRDDPDGCITLEPWPFACESLTVACEARVLARRERAQAALERSLREAPVRELRFVLRAR